MIKRKLATSFLRVVPWLIYLMAGFAHAQEASLAAPPLLLAHVASRDIDPAPYLISEKYDGVRAYWNGKTLRFRSGNRVNAPTWFIDRLPPPALDGELWLGRGRFEELSGVVRQQRPDDIDWRQVKYMIFELPNAPGSFAQRYNALRDLVRQSNWPQLQAVEQVRVGDRAGLQRKLDQVMRDGGEGLMLHRADALYVTGRSEVLLKLKPVLDSEAKVISHEPGKGKFEGMLGSLEVETPEGKRFRIGAGFSDAVRKNPPAIGSSVTYQYRGLTKNGLPRFASFLRIRQEF
ncbi:MAG: DNA ligase [Pseudomonadota bacterium]|nr:DNA ligase [Pseudomonadota bacterium]